MSHAKNVLIIYLLISFGVFLALLTLGIHTFVDDGSGSDERYYFLVNILSIYFVILVVIVVYGLTCFVRSFNKLTYATAALYLLIVFTAFVMEPVLELNIRWRMYAWHPEWCLNPLKPGQRATLCYEEQSTAGGSLPRIVYNPDDEMSLPESQWSKDLEQTFGGNLWTIRLARHIYLQDKLVDYDPD